jgi:Skp family chaperone for outer membrane proteins
MFSHRVVIVATLAGALALPLAPAHAQSTLGGKSIPGVCMLSRTQVLQESKVGQAADARLKQLADQARSDLDAERKPLTHDIQQFREQAGSMKPAQRESRQKALQERMQKFQHKAQVLDARIRITRGKAMKRIGDEIDPLLSGIYKQHRCGLLLDRDTVLGGNMDNDLTPGVIQALNKKMSTISFSLAPLPKQNQGK